MYALSRGECCVGSWRLTAQNHKPLHTSRVPACLRLLVPPKIDGVKRAPNVGTTCRGGSRGVRGYELGVALRVELNAAAPLVRAAPDRSRLLFVESEECPCGPGHGREDHGRVVNGAAWIWRRPPHKVAFTFLGARSFVHGTYDSPSRDKLQTDGAVSCVTRNIFLAHFVGYSRPHFTSPYFARSEKSPMFMSNAKRIALVIDRTTRPVSRRRTLRWPIRQG